MTTGREEDGDPEYVYELQKDGYDSDEWAEVWEKDMLICTDWSLKFATCEGHGGLPLLGPGGKEDGAELHPIAFCGLHNPKRDKALLGWPAGGAEAKEGHPFVFPKRTQPPYANEAIDKWASIYEKNLEIREKRKKGKGKKKEGAEEEKKTDPEVGRAEQPPKKGRKVPASRKEEEATAPASSQRRLQKGDQGWDSEQEEIALQEEILREQAKLDALRAKLKRKREQRGERKRAKAKTPPPKEDKKPTPPSPPPPPSPPMEKAPIPESKVAEEGGAKGVAAPAPKPKPKKRAQPKKSPTSRPMKGEDGWDSAQEELELQMEILREQEKEKQTKRRRVFKNTPEGETGTVPANAGADGAPSPIPEGNKSVPMETETTTTTTPKRWRDPFPGMDNPYL